MKRFIQIRFNQMNSTHMYYRSMKFWGPGEIPWTGLVQINFLAACRDMLFGYLINTILAWRTDALNEVYLGRVVFCLKE